MKRTPLRRQSPRGARNARLDAKLKKQMFEKWGKRCVFGPDSRCAGPLDAAHIYGKQAFPWLRHQLLNLLPLCRFHHTYAHLFPATASLSMFSKLTIEEQATLDAMARARR